MYSNSQGADAWVAPGEEHVLGQGLDKRFLSAVSGFGRLAEM